RPCAGRDRTPFGSIYRDSVAFKVYEKPRCRRMPLQPRFPASTRWVDPPTAPGARPSACEFLEKWPSPSVNNGRLYLLRLLHKTVAGCTPPVDICAALPKVPLPASPPPQHSW